LMLLSWHAAHAWAQGTVPIIPLIVCHTV
jgi:hypothetical protein